MKIYVNNKPIRCGENITIANLLTQLQQIHIGTALALNQLIIPREQWSILRICDGDRILIFKVIAGG